MDLNQMSIGTILGVFSKRMKTKETNKRGLLTRLKIREHLSVSSVKRRMEVAHVIGLLEHASIVGRRVILFETVRYHQRSLGIVRIRERKATRRIPVVCFLLQKMLQVLQVPFQDYFYR